MDGRKSLELSLDISLVTFLALLALFLAVSIGFMISGACVTADGRASVPVSATVDTDGAAFVRVSLGGVIVVTEGGAELIVQDALTGLPMIEHQLAGGVVAVYVSSQPGFAWRGPVGAPIPSHAEEIVRRLITGAEIAALGLLFESDGTH